MQLGLGTTLSLLPAVIGGGAGVVGVAALLRSFAKLERDATVSLDRAVGQMGTVYLTIPAGRSGLGKVHVMVQERTVECAAVTRDTALPTGTPILVVDVEGPDTLVVVRNPQLLEEPHVST